MFYFLLYCEQTNQDKRVIKTVKEVHRNKNVLQQRKQKIYYKRNGPYYPRLPYYKQKKEYKKNTSTYRTCMTHGLVGPYSTAVTK